ncbi:zinc finger protein 79-like [Drosophila kikkawai]|uniref:Zinc finger protein 79-like n=1 Tax=Drosophila kikkawai TaxID=30033 RepID=A0A6P4IZU9_DROKI|nr:zinc finger protein 23-like [Drosophila kikkawai]
MSEERRCNLCREEQAMEVDLEKPMYKAVNQLLQKLFECYKIDISILGESSCICQACFDGVLHISESLKKWSRAQEGLKDTPLEIDDSKAFQVKLEVPSSDDEEEISPEKDDEMDEEAAPEKDDEMDVAEDKTIEATEETKTPQGEGPKGTPKKSDFFCVAIGHDGMVIAKLFKDNTKATRLMCSCCDQPYDNMLQIRSHNPMTRKSPTYYCGTCGANFQKPKQLADHEEAEDHKKPLTRHRDINFRCLKCDEMFSRFSDTIRHENSIHSSVQYSCPSCQMPFKYYGSFQKHLRYHNSTNHSPPDVYDCNYPNCSRRFRVWKRYVKHMNWHRGTGQMCPFVGCNVTTAPGNYMSHMRSHYKMAHCELEGKFMKLDPAQRVHPDGRKVPYTRRIVPGEKEEPPVERIKVNPDGEFISLPKQIVFRKGRYINVSEKN